MAEFPFLVDYREQSHFVVTPNPTWAKFTGSDLTMNEINKGFVREYLPQPDDVVSEGLEVINIGTENDPVYRLKQLNQYGDENIFTAVWTSSPDENFSSLSPAFIDNNVTIVGGVESVEITGSSYDNTYSRVAGANGMMGFGDSWYTGSASDYWVYSVDIGGGQWQFIARSLVDFNEWKIGVTDIDPATWSGGSPIFNSSITYETLTTNEELFEGGYRPQASANIVYTSGGEGWAAFTGTQTFLNPDFFSQNDKFTIEYKQRNNTDISSGSITFFEGFLNSASNYMRIKTANGNIRFDCRNTNVPIFDISAPIPSSSGDEYDLAFEFQNYIGVNQGGIVRIYLNGEMVASDTFTTQIRNDLYEKFRFLPQGGIQAKNFRFTEGLKYDGANYTPVDELPDEPYAEVQQRIIDFDYNSIGDVQEFGGLNQAVLQGTKFTLNGLWHNATAWVPSTSPSEANTITEINDNAATFPATNDLELTAHFAAGSNEQSIDGVNYVYVAQGWANAFMAVLIQAFLPPKSFIGAKAVLSEPNQFTKVRFTLSKNGVMYYYSTVSDQWEPSDNTAAQSNTLDELNTHIHKFESAGLWYAHVFLVSEVDPQTGFQTNQAPSITFLEITGDVEAGQAPPPFRSLVYFFSTTPCGSIDENPIILRNELVWMYDNYKVQAGYSCTITPEDVVGLGAKSVIETASKNENATSVSEKYMYAMFQQEKVKIKVGTRTQNQIVDNFLGYVEIPMQGNVTLDYLWKNRVFERPANGIQTDEALAEAQEKYPIPPVTP